MCDGEHAGELGLVDGEVRGQRPGQLLVLGPELLHQSQVSIALTQPIRGQYSHLILQSLAGGDGLHGGHGAGGYYKIDQYYHHNHHSIHLVWRSSASAPRWSVPCCTSCLV